MSPDNPLESRLDSASTELRSQLGSSPVPDFEPNKRVAAPVAAIVAIIIAAGVLAATQFGSDTTSEVEFLDDTEQVDTPQPDTSNGDGSAPATTEEPDSSETPIPDSPGPGRTTTELVTAPEDVTLTFGMDDTQPAADRTRPTLGEQRNDPAYGSAVTRITDAGGRFNRLDVPTRMLVNSDDSLLITHVDNGTIEFMSIIDLDSLAPLTTLDLEEESEVAWHPTDPAVVRHLSGGNESNGSLQLFETNVVTNETTVLVDLTDRVQAIFPTATHMISGHGRPGNAGTTWAWIVRDSSEDPVGVISYDLASDTIVGSLSDLDPTNSTSEFSDIVNAGLTNGAGRMLTVVVAPDAKSILVEYEFVTTVHDPSFTTIQGIENLGDNADVVALANGGAAYVYVDFNAASETYGFITSVDLDTLEATGLINLFDDANTSVQLSGTAVNAPGWVLASTHSCKNDAGEDEAWTCNKVMVIELGGQNRIVPLAHTYGCGPEDGSWFAIPSAMANDDLSKIYFTSDSGTCTEGGEVFEIVVPDALQDLVSGS